MEEQNFECGMQRMDRHERDVILHHSVPLHLKIMPLVPTNFGQTGIVTQNQIEENLHL